MACIGTTLKYIHYMYLCMYMHTYVHMYVRSTYVHTHMTLNACKHVKTAVPAGVTLLLRTVTPNVFEIRV